jgi:small-conductance mechanosensitive channel
MPAMAEVHAVLATAAPLGAADVPLFAVAAYLLLLSAKLVLRQKEDLRNAGAALAVVAAAMIASRIGFDTEFSIRLEKADPPATLRVPAARTVLELAALFAVVSIGLGAVSAWRRVRTGEDLLVFQKAVYRYAALAAGALLVYQVHWGPQASLAKMALGLTAGGAVVIGLALQKSLANFGSGMQLQSEDVFRKGEMIQVGPGGTIGTVVEKTMRATRIVTLDGTMAFVPNADLVAKEVLNFDRPIRSVLMKFRIGASYDSPPLVVKEAVRQVLSDDPSVLPSPEPDVLTADYGDSAIVYEGRYWIADFRKRNEISDRLLTRLWYVLKDRGIEIPFPIRTVRTVAMEKEARRESAEEDRVSRHAATLARCRLFASYVTPAERREIARNVESLRFEARQTIVRKGEQSDSMYVVEEGECLVPRDGGDAFVIPAGAYFGEIALLRREPRSADVVAGPSGATVLRLARVTVEHVLRRNADMTTELAKVGKERLAELSGAAAALPPAVVERPFRWKDAVRAAGVVLRPW